MPIKSFRGLIDSNELQTISLHTNDGSTGYRIKKFQIFPYNFNVSDEYNVKIFKVAPESNTTTYDFSDQTLLAAAFIEVVAGSQEGVSPVVVFDNEVFNQDIYVSCKNQIDPPDQNQVNYYIELEQIKLDLAQNTTATLKDIRNITSQ